ncbi:MAG: GTP-binding protein [Alkalibacterium sp.]|nr:GTP-binding protein [Alkalibacterium sp.]
MITIADAQRLAQQFDPEIGKYNHEFLDSNQLIIKQIEYCDILLFNKLDLVADREKQYLTNLLRTLQPNARFIETTFSQVSQEQIIDTYLFDSTKPLLEDDDTDDLSDRKDTEAGDLGIESFVYRRRRPFHPARFDAWLDRWPRQVSRCKGVMWLITQPDDVFKVSQSGRAMDIIPSGYWIASLKQWEIDKMFDIRPHLQDIWHERFGDRMIELVFIGKDMDKKHIIESLDQCLYLDTEVIPYQSDPFRIG